MALDRIKTVGIQDDAITSAKIGVDVIAAEDLAANSVTVSEITDGAVTGPKLADNLNYDSGTLYLDSTNDKVGIGETSPLGKLHIKEGDSGVTSVSTDADQLVIENNAESGISLLAPTNSASRIAFGDSDNNKIGQIYYNHTSNFMKFDVDNAERVRLESGGHLMVGTTDTNPSNNGGAGNPGVAISPEGVFRAARTGNVLLDINRMGSDGEIAAFRKDGNTIGKIGTLSGNVWIGTGNTALRFAYAGLNTIVPWDTNTNALTDNTTSLGYSNTRFNNLYLGGGVYLGGTGSANYLDDYEEGTWTPVLKNQDPTTGTIVGTSSNNSKYVKIGNLVHANLYIQRNDASSLNNQIYVTGLPFTSDNYPAPNGSAWFDNSSSDWRALTYTGSSATWLYFILAGNSNSTLSTNNWDNSRYIYCSFTYRTS